MAYIKRPPAPPEPDLSGGLVLNQTVSHPTFGLGHVTHIDGARLTILFDKSGSKKIAAGFVTPA